MRVHLPPGGMTLDSTPSRARAATWLEVQKDSLQKFPEAIATAHCVATHGHAKDHALGRMNDVARTLGVASIAGLSSLGVTQSGGSVPLWLGAGSWLGAMALTPKIINAAVRLKTGVNLNAHYVSSNGEIRPLFQDPDYLPLQVLSPQEQQAMAERFNLKPGYMDPLEQMRTPLKRIAVQAHTWWMLMAGMATPVLAAVFCDLLEDPLKGVMTQMRFQKANQTFQAHTGASAKTVVKHAEAVVAATMEKGTDMTLMSRWWQKLPTELMKTLFLDELSPEVLKRSPLLNPNHPMVDHLYEVLSKPENRNALRLVLQQHRNDMNAIMSSAERVLQHKAVQRVIAKQHPDAVKLKKLTHLLGLERDAATATLSHFEKLLNVPYGKAPKAQAKAMLKQVMEEAVLPYLEQNNRMLDAQKAIRIAGSRLIHNNVTQALNSSNFEAAMSQMGASPAHVLSNAMKSLAMRKLWLRRFPLAIGGAMLVSSALFVTFVLGKNLNRAAKSEDVS